MPEYETWKNVSAGKRGVIRKDQDGRREDVFIAPGKAVEITREDRILYQRNVATESLDVFKNGALVPVQLLNDEDIKEMADNPNLITETNMVALFKLPIKKFESELEKITNVFALNRLAELAEESESVPVRKYNLVKERLEGIETVKKEKAATSAAKRTRKLEADFGSM